MTSITVTLDSTTITVSPVVKTVTQAFPAGLKGDRGDPAALYRTILTVDVNSHTVLAGTMAGIAIADNTNDAHLGNVIGITNQAALTGQPVEIIGSGGTISGFSGLTVGGKCYLSTAGIITQTLPVAGFIQQVGTAISATELSVNITMPIKLT